MTLKREAPLASLIDFFVEGLILREKDCGWNANHLYKNLVERKQELISTPLDQKKALMFRLRNIFY
jgi:hypothetical protein